MVRSKGPHSEFHDVLSFRPLREELRHFLENNNVSSHVTYRAAWARLFKLYIAVVSECPLVFNTAYRIKSATLVLREFADDPTLVRINTAWEWKFELKDGTTRGISFAQHTIR